MTQPQGAHLVGSGIVVTLRYAPAFGVTTKGILRAHAEVAAAW